MPFLINCTNKGCGQTQEPYLDQETGEVYCSLCNKILKGITPFAKNQMKVLKQFKPKSRKSFSVKCNHCNKEERPQVNGNQLICGLCKKVLNKLTPTFEAMIKEKLASLEKDDD
jgi:phage terminase large subunit GpA-like protein